MAKKNGPDFKIADMYERWTLDCVVELAQAVAADFVSRPRQYKDVSAAVAKSLESLWYLADTDPGFPGAAKRQMVFTPLLGPSDGKPGDKSSQFHMSSAALRERARAFTERQVQTGEDNLRRAFQDAVITLRSYLVTLRDNAVVNIGDAQTANIFGVSAAVLTDTGVAGVFGRAPSSESGWPEGGTFDDNGARVVEEVSKALQTSRGLVSQNDFIVMQRIATFGASTLRGVLADPDPSTVQLTDLDDLIQEAYRWKTAVDALGSAGSGVGPIEV